MSHRNARAVTVDLGGSDEAWFVVEEAWKRARAHQREDASQSWDARLAGLMRRVLYLSDDTRGENTTRCHGVMLLQGVIERRHGGLRSVLLRPASAGCRYDRD